MKLPFRLTHPALQRLVYSATSLLVGLAFMLSSHPMLAQSGGIYATPGLYTYTVPAGGPFQIKLTAQGGDGGGDGNGGSGARVGGTFTAQSGDVVTLIIGQSGVPVTGNPGNPANGGGGGGSAVILTHNGTPTLLLAAGGGGGGGTNQGGNFPMETIQGLGGRGIGTSSAGAGGPTGGNYSGSGGGGGLDGPGGNGTAGFNPGGIGGGRASLTAISPGGNSGANGAGGSGFGGGGGVGGYDSHPPQAAGGGGGGYGGGNGAGAFSTPQAVLNAQGGYSFVSPAGSATTVTPGADGASKNKDGLVILSFPNNTATAALTPVNQSICPGFSTNLQGTVSATGSWTLVLSDGTVGTGSGSTFSIPVSPVMSTTYNIAFLTDQQGLADANKLTGTAAVIISPTMSLTSNGPLTCTQSSVTLTASGATSYTFTTGSLTIAGDPASNIRVVTSPGTYSVVGSLDGCIRSATTTVTSVATVTVVNPATTFFVVGQAVSQAFTASGGVSPRSFSVVSGSLPPGLSLSADGQLSGSPTQTGNFPVVIQATDANGCPGLGAPYEVNVTQSTFTGPALTYTTPGLYTYTVPAGGPYRVWLTARGGDGGAQSLGGTGSRVEGSYFVQSGDLLTVIVGQSGRLFSRGGGGGGGGSAIVLTHSGTQTLLVAAGGGGGGGQVNITPGGGGQGLGPSTGGVGGRSTGNYSGGGGGGGLDAPGANGGSGFDPGGTGGGAASLTAPSSGGPYRSSDDGAGGSGFGGGGGVGGGDSLPGRPVGGGGGGYGGGHGGDNGAPVDGATGGYSYVSPAGSNTSVTPGIGGASRNREGVATIGFGQNTATAAITTTNLAVCQGTPSNIEGTVSATGSWTLVLTNGLTTTGSGTSFSIPVSPASPTTYTIESLLDDQGFAPVSNLSGQASVTEIKPVPTVSLTSNGPLTCTQSSVTLTASGATSYTFTTGSLPLAGDPASNIRVVTSLGTYSVVGVSQNGCTNSATTTVTSVATVTVVNPATTLFVVGQAVSQAFTASGGVSPRSFSVVSGSLPPGLSLSADGQLSGSPTQIGSFTAVIQATDANGCPGLGAPYEVNVTQPIDMSLVATYTTPGLYTYTVPAGGPYRVWLTARGGDGGAYSIGGTGARVEGSYTVQSGDLLTVMVGQSGKLGLGGDGNGSGGGGGGGSAVVLTHSGTQTLLVAAGGGGGGGRRNITPGGGGQGLGPSTGGEGGQNGISADGNYSGGGGGGGLDGPGGNGISGYSPGGTGGGAASLTALSVGGTYNDGSINGFGGSGFGGGGAIGGRDASPLRPVGGGGGGYGGGHGGDSVFPSNGGATGGYSYVSPAGSNTSVTPGIGGISRNRDGIATIDFSQNTATAAITTTSLAICDGSSANIEGTINAKGNWTIVLSNGTVGTGSGSTFSIPVSTIDIPRSYLYLTIESLLDDQGFAPVSNLSGQASVTINPRPTVSLTNNGPLTCAQPSVTLTASGATSYTFTTGNLTIAGDPASNTLVVNSPGTYAVVGSLNGCTRSATTTVTSLGIAVANPATSSFLVDQAVSQAFTASGGVSPRSFSVVSGSLPPGLSLSADGRLSGSPTQTGSFTVVIEATDANGCTGIGTPYVINVAPFSITSQPPASLLVCADNSVSVSVGVSGTPTAYQWYKNNTLVSGQTSATLSLASANPTDAGSYVVVITGGGLSLTSTAFSLTVGPVVPARFYVNASATGGNTGLDWANAFTDLQSALSAGNACANNLKEIWVAGGVYKPTPTGDRNVYFSLLSGVALYGGFVGNETILSQRPSVNPNMGSGGASQPSSSTLSGDIGQPGNALDNSQVVVAGIDLAPTTVLDGFVITGGRAEGNAGAVVGGGLSNIANSGSSSPTLNNLFFINNYSASIGGAILNYGLGGAASPVISNCRFEQNTTASAGGAIANLTASGNSRPVITNCFFAGNSATQWGGAIVNVAQGDTVSPVITNCAFQSNSATQGGAIWQATALASVLNALITNCSFSGNRAGEGGALYNATSIPGGAPAGGPIGLTLANSVLFDNGGATTFSNTGEVTLSARYSLLEASVTGYTDAGNNRTTASSPFASPTSLLLGAGSPAINAGDNGAYQTAGGPATDLGGNSRIQQTTIDMGAYESERQSDCQSALTLTVGASLPQANVGVVVSLTASASGAAGPLSYQWSAPGSASLTSPATSSAVLARLTTAGVQTFTVVATSGNCSQSALVSVTALSGPDLTAIVSLPDANFSAGETKGLLLQLQEVNGTAARGAIVMTISVPPGYSVNFDNTLTTISVSGGSANPVAVDNARWHQGSSVMGRQLSLMINEGQGVGANSTVSLGVRITRTSANSGSVSNITVNVADDSGGGYDVNRLNNVYARIIQAL
ncbi:putative Ig domain-containing protein [Spirosoma sp. KCTC 42546]|uniref:beta strand repeat-containing protein n=1 Tax=Spirosoma sp. KCTC 42546 TaxID=2520506 RepID=UPI001AEF7E52|nr:putative Ig domain-containing protein [Spirosoma sp. KCTC 42546]